MFQLSQLNTKNEKWRKMKIGRIDSWLSQVKQETISVKVKVMFKQIEIMVFYEKLNIGFWS
jgi:hypothetical protein